MPCIVPLDFSNVPYAVELCRELHGLGSYRHIEFDRHFTQLTCVNAVLDRNWYCHLAQDDSGIFTGLVAGHVTPFVFSPRLLGVENAWYVREGSQERTKLAMRLMRGFVSWCFDDRNAVHVQSGDVANINSLAVDALYRHMGFKRVGTIYKYQRAA